MKQISPITEQTTIFSNSPLKGFYKYRNLFQIFPPKKQNELFQHDHPLVIEIKFQKEIYPEHSDILWHRDVWEKERFEYIKRRSPKEKMDPSDHWVKAYQDQTKRLRPSAIFKEVCNLLTLFTCYRFFTYDGKQSWFIPIRNQPNGKIKISDESIWGQSGYISEYGGTVKNFTNITCDSAPLVPMDSYIKRFRDIKGYTEEDQIDFPDSINFLFDKYFSLPSIKKTVYYKACHIFNQALYFKYSIPSLSMVASVMAIENIMNFDTEDIPICENCNAPIYKSRSRFREFMSAYSLPDEDKLYKDMYDIRSRLAHGDLLREDLFDTGFYAGEKDNEDRLRKNSLIVVNEALLHWLVNCKDST